MPRDGSGNYTLPAGNPVVTGTTISSSTMNSTLTDLATAMTGSLSRSGLGGMLTAFENTDGVVGSPGITWASETTSGFYRAGSADMRASIAGVAISKWTTAGLNVLSGGLTVTTGGLTVTAGGTTITAGGLTVTAGGISVVAGTTALQATTVTGGLTVDGVTFASGLLPSQTGKAGKFLTTSGSAPSWSDVFVDSGTSLTIAESSTVIVSINGTTRGTFASTGLTLPDTLKVAYSTGLTTSPTINAPSGRVQVNSGGVTSTVTNSFVTGNSIILVECQTWTSTHRVVAGSGSFVVTFGSAFSNADIYAFVVFN